MVNAAAPLAPLWKNVGGEILPDSAAPRVRCWKRSCIIMDGESTHGAASRELVRGGNAQARLRAGWNDIGLPGSRLDRQAPSSGVESDR